MERLHANSPILGLSHVTVTDFWSWAYSDILSNRNRAVFAEFIVGYLLDALDAPRIEWDAVDLRYRGKTLEVKSAGYIQSWPQKRLSRVSFNIGRKYSWFADSNSCSPNAVRPADGYVFCLFVTTEHEKANVLDLDQWKFWTVSSMQMDREFKDCKSISLSKLSQIRQPVEYHTLKREVDQTLCLAN